MDFTRDVQIPDIPLLTKDRWNGILQCKEAFFSGDLDAPIRCKYLAPVIAASWIRSKKLGIDPHLHIREYPNTYPNSEYKRPDQPVLCSYSEFEEIAKPILKTFFKCITATKEKIISSGDSTYLILSADNFEFGIIQVQHVKTVPEEIFGTNIFPIVLELNQPVLMYGPENYCYEYHNIFSVAAPVYDMNHNMISILYLGTDMFNRPWESSVQVQYHQLFALVNSLATALESKMNLTFAYHDQESTNRLLSTTLSLINDGIVSVGMEGNIISSNNVACSFLQTKPNILKSQNIYNYFDKIDELKKAVTQGLKTTLEENLVTGNKTTAYFVQVYPLVDHSTKKTEGAVLRFAPLEKVNRQAIERVGLHASFSFQDIIGDSICMQRAKQTSRRWAHSSDNILLTGESGTGKELFAQSIHNESGVTGSFVAINCASIPKELLESELFGYERGSFTGADRNGRPGKIELANNGTLFLDEIGDMPYSQQSALLRVLQNKEVLRIGGSKPKHVNFRLVAATNQNLEKLINEKLFRADLYYRLSVLTIIIPPLRERGDDILTLCEYFLAKNCTRYGMPILHLSAEARKILLTYNWPGNIRQLENAMIFCANTVTTDMVLPEHLPPNILNYFRSVQSRNTQCFSESRHDIQVTGSWSPLENAENTTIRKALEQNQYNITKTASYLGISKATLYKKLKKYQISQ